MQTDLADQPAITPWAMPSPFTTLKSTKQLTAAAVFNGVSATGTFGLAFKGMSGSNLDGLSLSDVETDGISTVMRGFGGSARGHSIKHIRQKNAGYVGGAGVGGAMFSNTDVTGFSWSDWDIEITHPWTNPNDAYAAACLFGKDAGDKCDFGSMSDLRMRVTCDPSYDYSAYLAAHPNADPYPNGDGIGMEGNYKNIDADRIYVENFPDGGADIKAIGFRMRDFTSVKCGKGYRRWSPSADERPDGSIEIIEPRECFLMRMGVGAHVIEHLSTHMIDPNTPADPNVPLLFFRIDQQHETSNNLLPGPRQVIVQSVQMDALAGFTDEQLVSGDPVLRGRCELVLPDRVIAF